MNTKVSIEPITRLEGHGKIEIYLDDKGNVDRAWFPGAGTARVRKIRTGPPGRRHAADHVADLRRLPHRPSHGIHQGAGRPLQGHPAGGGQKGPGAGLFDVHDRRPHAALLLSGRARFRGLAPAAPKAERNVLGVIAKVGIETGQKVIAMRRKLRELTALAAGKPIHPVFGLPGGVAKPLSADTLAQFKTVAAEAVDFALFTLDVFDKIVLENSGYVDLIVSDGFTHKTYYMGMVDEKNRLNFYDGSMRVVAPEGNESARFASRDYAQYIAERTEPWSYMKFYVSQGPRLDRASTKAVRAASTAWLRWPA